MLPLKPRELQSVSRLTARAASLSLRSSFFQVTLSISAAFKDFKFFSLFATMYRKPSPNSTNSDVFYVEQSSPERSPIRTNTPVILNSTQLSEAMDPETITISSVASPEPQIVTLDSNSNEPTFPYAFGAQHSIVPPSLNDLNIPPNLFNVLATMAVIHHDREQSRQSQEPSDLFPISTTPMNVSTIDDGDTTHTRLRMITLSTRLITTLDEYTGTCLQTKLLNQMNPGESIPLEARLPHRRPSVTKEEIEYRDVFSQKTGSVAAHLRGMWPAPSTDKDILTPNEKLKTPNTTN